MVPPPAEEEEDEEECYICTEPLSQVLEEGEGGGDTHTHTHTHVVILDCGNEHRYHRMCVRAWHVQCARKALPITCPTCRGVCTSAVVRCV